MFTLYSKPCTVFKCSQRAQIHVSFKNVFKLIKDFERKKNTNSTCQAVIYFLYNEIKF